MTYKLKMKIWIYPTMSFTWCDQKICWIFFS